MRTTPPRRAPPSVRARRALAQIAAGALGTLAALPAGAQVIGLPAVQSPFRARRWAVAVNGGVASQGVRTAAVAGAYRRSEGGRLLLTAGVGATKPGDAVDRYVLSGGARLAFLLAFGQAQSFAAAPFAGVGGLRAETPGATPGAADVTTSFVKAPFGVSLGYRRLVAGRAVTVHVAPQGQYWRAVVKGDPPDTSATVFRVGVGADVALTRRIGLSVGWEGGGQAELGALGPRASVFGVGLSFGPGGRGGAGQGGAGRPAAEP